MENIHGSCGPCIRVAEMISRLRSHEDYDLAVRLQEEEFKQHYEMRRHQRQQILNDQKYSWNEQQMEDELAIRFRQHLNSQMTKDEALARHLEEEFEREEQLQRESQTRRDEELARHLQNTEHKNATVQKMQMQADERLANCLQRNESHHLSQNEVSENCAACQQVLRQDVVVSVQQNV